MIEALLKSASLLLYDVQTQVDDEGISARLYGIQQLISRAADEAGHTSRVQTAEVPVTYKSVMCADYYESEDAEAEKRSRAKAEEQKGAAEKTAEAPKETPAADVRKSTIFRLWKAGKTAKQIAEEAGISEVTARKWIKKIVEEQK